MKHFLEINQLSKADAEELIQRALYFKAQQSFPNYSNRTIANLFYENSTRTRVSFERAAHLLGMSVINLDLQQSSEQKGETILDTLNTLAAMGIETFVIRHKENGLPAELATKSHAKHIINAGDGTHAHPTQALLDLMTILEENPNFPDLKIAIVGNLRHSRVANSFQRVCALFAVRELSLIAPEIWQPTVVHYGQVTSSIQEGIENADVVICLRVQFERLAANEHMDLNHYREKFAVTREHLKWAKPGAIVMHPGPINRGVEIDNEIADGFQSRILTQVTNSVFLRMAVLEKLQGHKS